MSKSSQPARVNKWEKMPVKIDPLGTSGGNYILSNNDILISYQPWKEHKDDFVFSPLVYMFKEEEEEKDQPETALHDKETDEWMILYGDFRKNYEKLWPDKKKCIAFYKKMKPQHGSKTWSTDE